MSVPVLTCHNLYKSYKGGKMVLDGFQCSLASGKIIGLLGPNGCGKSPHPVHPRDATAC